MNTKPNKTSYKKGHIPWSTGGYKRITRQCFLCKKNVTRSFSSMVSKNIFCSNVCRLKNQENNNKEFNCEECGKECFYSDYNFQRSIRFCNFDCATRNRAKKLSGSNSHFWKGGLTKENTLLRNSYLTSQWRKDVFSRDDYTCQACGLRSGNGKAVWLEAHHVKSWSDYPDLRWEINNGVTLCESCHRQTNNYGRKKW